MGLGLIDRFRPDRLYALNFTALALLVGMHPTPAISAPPISYQADLSSAPHTLATRANVMGMGAVTATLAGRTLTVSGAYKGLPSAATKAHLKMGLVMGTPGVAFADLAVTGGTSGTLLGTARLTPAQLTSLNAGGLSIVIDSVKAPEGNIWGWLIPAAPTP